MIGRIILFATLLALAGWFSWLYRYDHIIDERNSQLLILDRWQGKLSICDVELKEYNSSSKTYVSGCYEVPKRHLR